MQFKPLSLLTLCVIVSSLAGCRATSQAEDTTLRVMAYNIKHGRGNDGKVDLERAAAVIEASDPDVVTLQEIDEVCGRSGSIDEATWLGERLGMEPLFGAFMAYDGGRYGMAMLSRLPILEWENHVLPPGAEPRSALAARLRLADGSELVVVGIHLYANEEQRLAQAKKLMEIFARETAPVILAGDFNSRPGSPVMELLGCEWMNPDKGEDRFTFDSENPDREIDYILYRPVNRLEVLWLDVLDEQMASDHRPLVLELRVRQDEVAWQRLPKTPHADSGLVGRHSSRVRRRVFGRVSAREPFPMTSDLWPDPRSTPQDCAQTASKRVCFERFP